MKILPSTLGAQIRLGVLVCILVTVSYVFKAQVVLYRLEYAPQEGDVVFQSLPHEELVDAIEGVTHSPYSHCGVVLRKDNQWVVIESIMDVHETPLFQWMIRGRSGGIAAYRLDAKFKSLLPEFAKNLVAYEGYPYDYDYEISDKAIYCSELPYKAFLKTTGEELGTLEKLGDLDWKPYQQFIKAFQGNHVPLDRLMITPASLSKAKQLQLVFRKGI